MIEVRFESDPLGPGLRRLHQNPLLKFFILADHPALRPRHRAELQHWLLRRRRGLRAPPVGNLQELHGLLVLGRPVGHDSLHRNDRAVQRLQIQQQQHFHLAHPEVLTAVPVSPIIRLLKLLKLNTIFNKINAFLAEHPLLR